MIHKEHGGYVVRSKKGKKLSKRMSKSAALDQLREIEMFAKKG